MGGTSTRLVAAASAAVLLIAGGSAAATPAVPSVDSGLVMEVRMTQTRRVWLVDPLVLPPVRWV